MIHQLIEREFIAAAIVKSIVIIERSIIIADIELVKPLCRKRKAERCVFQSLCQPDL